MSKKHRKVRRNKSPTRDYREPVESRASEAITIAWTVSVTGVFVADLIVVAAHLYIRSHPQSQPARRARSDHADLGGRHGRCLAGATAGGLANTPRSRPLKVMSSLPSLVAAAPIYRADWAVCYWDGQTSSV